MIDTKSTTDKKRPAFRINFCPRIERDGKQQLGRSIEIGAAWELEKGRGYRMSFNIVPQNLSEGVTFLNPIMDQEQSQQSEGDVEQEME